MMSSSHGTSSTTSTERKANVSLGFNRILENLPMYGFGSVKLAHIQTIKELVENSIDAFQTVRAPNPSITVSISPDNSRSDFIVIAVTGDKPS